jgi:hypothetical protein
MPRNRKTGNKPSGTLYTVRDDPTKSPSKTERDIERNITHTEDFLFKIAIATRLETYAAARQLGQHIDGHPREDFLRKIRRRGKIGKWLSFVEWDCEWLAGYDARLILLGLPPLEDPEE